MKDWQEIVRRYEDGAIYLGEAANLLTHNVNYEISALKRTQQRCTGRLTDLDRKEKEHNIAAAQ